MIGNVDNRWLPAMIDWDPANNNFGTLGLL